MSKSIFIAIVLLLAVPAWGQDWSGTMCLKEIAGTELIWGPCENKELTIKWADNLSFEICLETETPPESPYNGVDDSEIIFFDGNMMVEYSQVYKSCEGPSFTVRPGLRSDGVVVWRNVEGGDE